MQQVGMSGVNLYSSLGLGSEQKVAASQAPVANTGTANQSMSLQSSAVVQISDEGKKKFTDEQNATLLSGNGTIPPEPVDQGDTDTESQLEARSMAASGNGTIPPDPDKRP